MARIRKQYNISELAELMKSVSHKLRVFREAEEISQSELGRRCGVSQSTINEIENEAATDVQLSTLCQLAKAFGKEVPDFLTRSDLNLTDPDRKELLTAAEDIERAYKKIERLRRRVK